MRQLLERFPNSNLGLLLGNIIDVEGDSPEANEKVLGLIGDYPHPSYQSTKSIHHLFLTPDPSLRRVVYQDIEFRGFGHQSVLPPSIVNGVQYRWMKDFKFPVPVMPDKLLAFYKKITAKAKKSDIKPGHMKLPCSVCKNTKYIHKKRFELELEAFKEWELQWQCQSCREFDLRGICRRIRADKKRGILV
jgi:hypothetical protein